MSINLDYIIPPVLTGYVRELPTPPLYTLNRWLPDVTIQDIEVAWDVLTRTNRTAKFRSWDAATPPGKRDSFQRNRINLPPLGEQLILAEHERLMLQQVANGGDTRNRLVDGLYNDADVITRAVHARMELARGDVLTDGKFTLTGENGLTYEVDYGVPGGNIVTAGVLWSDHTNADPLGDLRSWSDTYIAGCGEPPAWGLVNRTIMGDLLRNQNIRAEVSSLAGVPSLVTPAQLNQVLAAHELPQMVGYDTQVDVDGASTRPVPVNRCVLMPQDPNELGMTAWGITATALQIAMSTDMRMAFQDLPGLIGVILDEGEPNRLWTKVDAAGMPIIKDPRKLFVATVL